MLVGRILKRLPGISFFYVDWFKKFIKLVDITLIKRFLILYTTITKMTNYQLPYFGQIDLTQLEEYYDVDIKWNERKLNIDLNFEGKTISEAEIEKVKTFLDNISKFDAQNKIHIQDDFETQPSMTVDYINFYLDEFDDEELSEIIGINDKQTSKEIQLLNQLKLVRIGFYPDGKYDSESHAVFDYSIDLDGEPSNQLLVVIIDKNGELDHITWES